MSDTTDPTELTATSPDVEPQPDQPAPAMDAAPTPAPDPFRIPLNDRMRTRLNRDYTYHAPVADQVERYASIRDKARELATLIAQCVPESRELHASLTSLETAIFQANAGIARNPNPA
jgi:hypothetical protein